MKSYVIAWAALLLSSCSAWAEAPAMNVSYCQLAQDPSAWIGKRVRVGAIYHYGFELQRLESPACCAEKGPEIWVDISSNLEGHSKKLFHRINKLEMAWALVVFVGRFEGSSDYGTGQRFHFAVDEIEKVEKTAKPRHLVAPDWVPKDCPAEVP
jgi:hypothetical protein